MKRPLHVGGSGMAWYADEGKEPVGGQLYVDDDGRVSFVKDEDATELEEAKPER